MVFTEESNLKHILKTRQINQKQKKIYLKKPTDKTWIPLENRYTTETFIETKNNEIIVEVAHIFPPKYSTLSKGEQKALEDPQERDDIVIVNADKGGAVAIIDV